MAGGFIAAALAVPSAASATFPTDGGRIVVSDGGGISTSVWPDGTHSQAEPNFPNTSKVDSWHAGGSKLVFTDGDSEAYEVQDGSSTITYWPAPDSSPIAGAALSPDGSRVAISTDTAVMLLDGSPSPEVVYEAPAGRVAWSAQTNEGTLVWDGFGVVSDPGIPGGGDLPGPFPSQDGAGAGIWMRVDGATPVEVVKEASATNPSISQNGKLIAWEQDGPTGGTDIYYLDPTEQNPVAHHLADSTIGSDIMPAVSPDGAQIAFVSDATGTQTLRVANVNGAPGSVVRTEPDGITGVAWQPVTKASAGSVAVSGAAQVGATLTAVGDPSSGTAPVTDSYEWQRCDIVIPPDVDPCVNAGTGPTYTVAEADRGHALRVVKTAKNPAGSRSASSSLTAIVPGVDSPSTPSTPTDSTPPLEPTLTVTPASQDKDTTPTFEWTGAESGGAFQCRLTSDQMGSDSSAWVSCVSPFTAPTELSDGSHTFAVRQVDDADNLGSIRDFQWTVDTQGPAALTLTAKPLNPTLSTSATFEFAGVEQGGTVQCRLDPLPEDQPVGSWHTCGSPQTFDNLAVGTHTFQVRELDAAGNPGTVTTWSWTILPQINIPSIPSTPSTPTDSTPPLKPTLTVTPATEDKDTTPTFEWTGAESGGAFQCRLTAGLTESDSGGWVSCASPFTLPTELSDGYYTFAVRQLDDANNVGSIRYHEWKVDTEGPAALLLTAKPAVHTSSTSATFEFAGVEQGGTVQCRLDPHPDEQSIGSWHTCGSPQTFDDLAVGTHTFQVRELDAAGNPGTVTTWSWTIEQISIPSVPSTPSTPETPTKHKPEPEAPAKPETPVVEIPAVEKPKPEAPVAKPATPKPPALIAVIGGTKTGGKVGESGGTSSAATIEVAKESVGVGCSITGTLLKSCKVDLYAPVGAGAGARAAAAKQVLVGTGTYVQAAGSSKMDVKVELNATGKAMLRRSPAGLRVSVKITGTPVSGAPLKAAGVAKLVTDRASLTVGGFAVDSAVLTSAAKAQLRTLAKFGKAAKAQLVGHTDGSTDDAQYLRSLGAKRAKAVFAFLTAHGVKVVAPTLVSKADTAPVATNATKAGRAKNRRVDVTLVR